ncbi:hypothetical protein M426DRAFT_318313 [Hypoxylon sp. CI-4A]|nr:hypothetical protein M426DRAFT_318313 [Hypoxylon sp. CI-4A]
MMSGYATILKTTALCYYIFFGSLGDAALLATCLLWTKGVPSYIFEINYLQVFIPATIIATTFAFAYFTFVRRKPRIEPFTWDSPGRPLLFPCQTTHTRFFPKKHSFSYSYLLVGVPIGWTGAAGGMIASHEHASGADGWYRVNAADYLERGNGHLGLRGKLDAFLESQGVDASRYPYAYLATAAKFLGYHFNPVSFWYLYSTEKRLTAMILEVNNTFDERHMYLLTTDEQTKSIEALGDEPNEGTVPVFDLDKSKPFKNTWQKDFHVSPFNSRKGAYSLTAHDPLLPSMEGQGLINNTINLTSSKNHAKLVARIFSLGDAIDPTQMSFIQKISFLTSWWWVSFVTFPRILKEATLLFFQRGLHVWFRPEPLKSSIGRHADETETQLELVFRRYLRYLVEQSPEALVVEYISGGITGAPVETMMSAKAREAPNLAGKTEFKVLTPAFYSRFVYYAHDFEAIFSELNESNTIWISKPELLPKLFIKAQPPPPLQTTSYLDYGCFTAIKNLRQRPERLEHPLTSSQTTTTTRPQKDIRGFRLSSMDGYVLAHEDAQSRQAYRNSVLSMFIADKIALGSVGILRLEHWVFRILLAWIAML